jgi:hypothetical protein
LAGDFLAAFFVVRALVVLRDELLAAEVTFAVASSSVAGTRASCICRRTRWSTSHEKVARPGDGYQHFAQAVFRAPRRTTCVDVCTDVARTT